MNRNRAALAAMLVAGLPTPLLAWRWNWAPLSLAWAVKVQVTPVWSAITTQVLPLLLRSHWKVGVGLPLAAAGKLSE